MVQYFDQIYLGEDYEPFEGPGADDIAAVIPEAPPTFPTLRGQEAYEIEMAVAFADCADEVEYREAVIAASDAEEQAAYAAIETELCAYQATPRCAEDREDLLEAGAPASTSIPWRGRADARPAIGKVNQSPASTSASCDDWYTVLPSPGLHRQLSRTR